MSIASPGYDAEAVYSPDGSMIAFTSTRPTNIFMADWVE
ncbi:MAG: PD40 domain-containing protein [Candidatus Zixiibacteriota bacterium]|nr:MAG: PD40 domain-containing protein [candidate division Zixibacteria bacterium]